TFDGFLGGRSRRSGILGGVRRGVGLRRVRGCSGRRLRRGARRRGDRRLTAISDVGADIEHVAPVHEGDAGGGAFTRGDVGDGGRANRRVAGRRRVHRVLADGVIRAARAVGGCGLAIGAGGLGHVDTAGGRRDRDARATAVARSR